MILAADPAPKLSDYGFFTDAGARTPAESVAPYDLVNALFSDNAAKHRLVYVPKGAAATYNDTDVFDFPVGSVLIKTFAFAPDMRQPTVDERYIETRLLIHKADGWAAYPYIWNAEQTEATYAAVGGKQTIDTITAEGQPLQIAYTIPNRNQCKECHQSDRVLQPIGPKARNLNHVGPAGVDQIADWTRRGILTGVPADHPLAELPRAFDASLPLEGRARAYLDINCAHCHNATGSASNSGLYLGWGEQDPTGLGYPQTANRSGQGIGRAVLRHRTRPAGRVDPHLPDGLEGGRRDDA